MYKGIYIALSGATSKQRQLELLSRDLANSSTQGYKRNDISFKEFLLPRDPVAAAGVDARSMSVVSSINTDFTDGEEIRTGNPLDLAIGGRGFFSIEGGRYTRAGSFKVDGEGYLVNWEGEKVLGMDGPIQLPEGDISVSLEGEVSIGGSIAGTLRVVDFKDLTLMKGAGQYFITGQKPVASKADVHQGYIETSNVNTIREMTGMITTLREFEAMKKMIQAFDEVAGKAVNDLGKI